MVQQLFKQLLNRLGQTLSWRSGEIRRSRRRSSLSIDTSQSLSAILAESNLRSLAEVADDFAAETYPQSWQSVPTMESQSARMFTYSIRVNEVIATSNLTIKALNRQLTTERRVIRAVATSSRQITEVANIEETSKTLKAPPQRILAPDPETAQETSRGYVPTVEKPIFERKRGVVKLLFKLKKRNHHGYISPDDGSQDIIFHQKYVGLEVIDRLERGMRVEVITRRTAGKAYAERLRLLDE
jgi:cold shock CspA family protein